MWCNRKAFVLSSGDHEVKSQSHSQSRIGRAAWVREIAYCDSAVNHSDASQSRAEFMYVEEGRLHVMQHKKVRLTGLHFL